MSRVKYFDRYYGVLGLSPGSTDSDIKAAYRTLAKKYHPDRSGTEDTRILFIEVNEAYEMLMKRQVFIDDALQRIREKDSARQSYPGKEQMREKAASYADMKFEAFAKTPIYRTAMAMSRMFDYLFLGVGGMMVIAPVFAYFADIPKAAQRGEEPVFHALPVVFGICFLYGLWYFIFKNKD
jgi:tetrahydromethanopterin S-methyltransferase subunit B